MADFLTARGTDGAKLWTCVDPDALCSKPAIAERRFAAYLAPFPSFDEARQALLEAGAEPDTVTTELRPKRSRRG